MGETDTPDFNKARGYLLGFSTVVLLLWYFGADLSAFKLLGNEIKLKENVKNVWLVLALINFYLWLRLYQRTPVGSFRFDLAMHKLYEKTLISVVTFIRRKELKDFVEREILGPTITASEGYKFDSFNAKGKIAIYESDHTLKTPDAQHLLETLRNIDSTARNEIQYDFHIYFTYHEGERQKYSVNHSPVQPSSFITKMVKWYVFVRGAFVSPWFFDHVTPFVWGGISICVALFKWWQINFPQV